MKCATCGHYHRGFVPCEALPREVELRQQCDFCPDARWNELTSLPGHPEARRYYETDMSREGVQAAQCPRCGTVWLMRYQWDAGTGSDNEAWVHELGPKEE